MGILNFFFFFFKKKNFFAPPTQRWPSLSGLRTIRTVWIRPVDDVHREHAPDPHRGVLPGKGASRLNSRHARGELVRVDLAGFQERQRPRGLDAARPPLAGAARPGLARTRPGCPFTRTRRLSNSADDGRTCDTAAMKRAMSAAPTGEKGRPRLAAAVGVQDGVLGEQLLQGLQLALLSGREEPFEQGVARGLVGVEWRAAGLENVPPRPRHDLPRVHLALLDDLGDLARTRSRTPRAAGRPPARPGLSRSSRTSMASDSESASSAREAGPVPGPRPAAPAATARRTPRDAPAPTGGR